MYQCYSRFHFWAQSKLAVIDSIRLFWLDSDFFFYFVCFFDPN